MQVIARTPGFIEGMQHQTLVEMASLRERLRDVPSDPEARVGLARRLLECGELGEAFLHLRIATVPGSHRGQASYLMGLAHIWSGDLSAAVDHLLLAVRLLPASAPALAALDVALGGIVETPAPNKRAAEPSRRKNRVERVNPRPLQIAYS